jgi:xanthine dehydrogenase small subunit
MVSEVLDLTRVAELRHYRPHCHAWRLARHITDAFAALVALRPQLRNCYAGLPGCQLRNSGTLGGNGCGCRSVIRCLLIALNSTVV